MQEKKQRKKGQEGGRDLVKDAFTKLTRRPEVEMVGFLGDNGISGGFCRLLPEQRD